MLAADCNCCTVQCPLGKFFCQGLQSSWYSSFLNVGHIVLASSLIVHKSRGLEVALSCQFYMDAVVALCQLWMLALSDF